MASKSSINIQDISGIDFHIDLDDDIEISLDVISEDFSSGNSIIFKENEIPDDVFCGKVDVGEINKIPELVFVEENDLLVLHIDSFADAIFDQTSSSSTSKKKFICDKCKKEYEKELCYKKHQRDCKVNKTEQDTSTKKKRKKKKVIKTINKDKELDEFFQKRSHFAIKTLKDITTSKLYTLTKSGKEIASLASQLIKLIEQNNVTIDNHFSTLSKSIIEIVNVDSFKVAQREQMLKNFHNKTTVKAHLESWKAVLSDNSLSIGNNKHEIIHQKILNNFLKEVLILITKKEDNSKEVEIELDRNEKETLRYVSGFIIFSLKNNINYKNPTEANAVLNMLDMWSIKGDVDKDNNISFIDYTTAWIDQVNRGGLYNVNNDFYEFICIIETIAQSVLNTDLVVNYCGEDLRKILFKKFMENEKLQRFWENLVREIPNRHLSEFVKEIIFKKWINIRSYAFVNTWVQIMKRKSTYHSDVKKISEKGEASLRKTLSTSKRKFDK